jgi:ketol-acid reductoisomerase
MAVTKKKKAVGKKARAVATATPATRAVAKKSVVKKTRAAKKTAVKKSAARKESSVIMTEMDFGGKKENVVLRKNFSVAKARQVLKDEVIAIIGYGVQGPAQALNLKDNGFNNVIIGQSKKYKKDWDRAVKDGWVPGKTLFDVEEAAKKGTIIKLLVSDAAQRAIWPTVKKHLTKGKALYFSHGFSIVYKNQTNVIPPKDVDVVMVAPKGSGRSVRLNFLAGVGINSSYAIFQNATKRAEERCIAIGIGIGSGYLFPTTFEKEVYSDLTGERGVLMGALAGIMEAQYDVLRKNGHSPSEAFNETVEELTQSLIRLVDENGMDWMYSNCSATAQRGALDWKPKFKKATLPVFTELYQSVKSGKETKRVLTVCGKPNYKELLDKELSTMGNSEMWQAGQAVRSLRPKEKAREITKETKGVSGRKKN